jgi:hypothetical protein
MSVLVLALLVAMASPGLAKCDPASDPDKSDIANARAAVAANCDCDPSRAVPVLPVLLAESVRDHDDVDVRS